MDLSPVADRYAEALFASAKSAGEVDATLEQLQVLGRLIAQQPRLREYFLNPGVAPQVKVGMLDRVTGGTWTGRVRAFMRMLAAASRAEQLSDIVAAFELRVDAEKRRVHATVRSVRKLSPEAASRLKAALERREGKEVLLAEELDPRLVGGLQVLIENRVIDGSVRRRLAELHTQLRSVSVA